MLLYICGKEVTTMKNELINAKVEDLKTLEMAKKNIDTKIKAIQADLKECLKKEGVDELSTDKYIIRIVCSSFQIFYQRLSSIFCHKYCSNFRSFSHHRKLFTVRIYLRSVSKQ